MGSLREKILKYGSLSVLLTMPIWVNTKWVFGYATTKTFFIYAAIEILLAFWIYSVVTDSSYRVSKYQLLWCIPIGLYICWMTISGIFGVNPHLSFWSSLGRGTGLLTLYHMSVLLIMQLSLANKYGERYRLRIAQALYWGGIVVALSLWIGDEGLRFPYQILEKAGGGGVTGNSSLAGGYLVIAVAMGIYILVTEKVSQRVQIYTSIGIGFILLSPIFINILGLLRGGSILGSARGALLGVVILVVVYMIMRGAYASRRWLRTTAVIIGFAMIAGFGISWHSLMTPGTVLHQKFAEVASETRFAFWHIAQRTLDDRPILGYGSDNFPSAVSRHFIPKMLDKSLAFEAWTDRAHNIYFDTGVAGGYPAIFLYACFFASIGYASYQGYRKGRFTAGQSAAAIAMVVGYVFQDLFYFDSTIALIGIGAVAGLAYSAASHQGPSARKSVTVRTQNSQTWLILGLVILTIVSVNFFVYKPARKSALFAQIIAAPIDKRADRYTELIEGGSIGNDWDVSGFAHDLYRLYATNPLEIKTDQKILPYVTKDIFSFLQYLESVAVENKTDYRLYISIVHLYSTYIYLTDMPYNVELASRLLSYLEFAHTLSPRDPQVYWGMAQIAAWQNDIGQVVVQYKKAIDLDPTLPSSHKLLLAILENTNNKRAYAEALQYAKSNIPNFTP